MAGTIVITMSGEGKRFTDGGYRLPKYEVTVHGRTLLWWSLVGLTRFIGGGWPVIFVAREKARAGEFIRSEARLLGIRTFEIVELDAPTDGQATTAMLATGAVSDPAAPIAVYNIDTFVHPRSLDPGAVRGNGWIPCFPGDGEGWSFVSAEADGRAREVREKVRISPHATVGLYWFSSFELYRSTYESYYSVPENIERGERYIAPLYNSLIRSGHEVYIEQIPKSDVIPLGTPAEVERFSRDKPPELTSFLP